MGPSEMGIITHEMGKPTDHNPGEYQELYVDQCQIYKDDQISGTKCTEVKSCRENVVFSFIILKFMYENYFIGCF